jgi:hypothetical protein
MLLGGPLVRKTRDHRQNDDRYCTKHGRSRDTTIPTTTPGPYFVGEHRLCPRDPKECQARRESDVGTVRRLTRAKVGLFPGIPCKIGDVPGLNTATVCDMAVLCDYAVDILPLYRSGVIFTIRRI